MFDVTLRACAFAPHAFLALTMCWFEPVYAFDEKPPQRMTVYDRVFEAALLKGLTSVRMGAEFTIAPEVRKATAAGSLVRRIASVTANAVRVRASPSLDGAVLRLVNAGRVVTRLRERRGWTQVALSPGTRGIGWIHSTLLQHGATPEQLARADSERGTADAHVEAQTLTRAKHASRRWVVLATTVEVSSQPAPGSASLASLERGHEVLVVQQPPGWLRVVVPTTGIKGWIPAQTAEPAAVVAAAAAAFIRRLNKAYAKTVR